MKLDSLKLKEIIQEVLNEVQAQTDPVKLQNKMMTGGQFVTKGKEQRADVDAEVDNNERAMINQIDQFLLGLAAKPGIDLQKFRLQVQTVLNKLNQVIGKTAQQPEEPQQGESQQWQQFMK